MKGNEKIIEDYINFRRNIENNNNEKTLKTQRFCLVTLSRSLKNKNFKNANEKDIAHYLSKYSDKTKNDRITIIRKFYRWLFDIEKGERLPDCVRRLKRTVKTPLQYYNNLNYRERIVSKEEYNALIDNSRMLKHKAMIETIYNFGIRASELISMNACDVNYTEDGFTKIIVRNSKTIPRDVSIEGRFEYLMKWYENYQHFKGKKNKPLWTNFQKGKHNRYTIGSLEKAIRVICKRSGLRHITPHDFRHTAITRFRKNGEKDTHIKSVFGLSKNSSMMEVYDHNKMEDYEKELRERIKNPKPTYEQMEKKQDKIEEQQIQIDELNNKLDKLLYYLEESRKVEVNGKVLVNPITGKDKDGNIGILIPDSDKKDMIFVDKSKLQEKIRKS